MPRLNGSRSTVAPAAAATSAVRSVEPSATTTISKRGSNARISRITPPIAPSSFSAGTIAHRFGSASNAGSLAQPEELEQSPGATLVGVLVEHALPGAPPHLLGLRGITQQLPVCGERLVGVVHDEQLAPRLEPALDPLARIRDDRGAAGSQ